jgi:hypothetical protein
MGHHRKLWRALPSVLAIVLTACGGGGGSEVASTPPPPGTPTPPPSSGSFSWDYAVPVAGARMGVTINLGTGATTGASILGPASYDQIRVQENGGEYAIWSGHSKWDDNIPIFVTADRGAKPRSGDETNNFDYYRFDSSGLGDELQLLKRSASNSRIQLSYLTYGLYSEASGAETARHFSTGVFVIGQETATASMPRTGTGSYSGIVDGYASVGGAGYRLLGSTGTLSANFANGTIATTLVLQGNSDFLNGTLGSVRPFGTLDGLGMFASGTSHYSGTLTGLGMSGQFAGGFFGPTANETGYSFSASGGGDVMTGVFVGKH